MSSKSWERINLAKASILMGSIDPSFAENGWIWLNEKTCQFKVGTITFTEYANTERLLVQGPESKIKVAVKIAYLIGNKIVNYHCPYKYTVVDDKLLRMLETDNLQVGKQEYLKDYLGEIRKREVKKASQEGKSIGVFQWKPNNQDSPMLERLKKEFMRDVSAYVTNWKPKEQDGDHIANRIEDEMIREREHSLFSILLSIPFILSCRIKTLTNALFPTLK